MRKLSVTVTLLLVLWGCAAAVKQSDPVGGLLSSEYIAYINNRLAQAESGTLEGLWRSEDSKSVVAIVATRNTKAGPNPVGPEFAGYPSHEDSNGWSFGEPVLFMTRTHAGPVYSVTLKENGKESPVGTTTFSNGDSVIEIRFPSDRPGKKEMNRLVRMSLEAEALKEAMARGRFDEAERLLERGTPVDARDQLGKTTLMRSAAGGDLDAVRFLIAHGADVNARDLSGSTPIMSASTYQGTPEITSLLLQKGASISTQNGGGIDALYLAIETHKLDTIRFLIQSGAPIRGSLVHAAWLFNSEIVELLLASGADVNEVENGATALMVASMFSDEDTVRALLRARADVNAVGSSESIIHILVLAGEEEEKIRRENMTALYLAKMNDNPAIIKLLKEAGATQ